MSFLSYRTRIPRHFDSHANVRSTTHRRGLWPCDRSQPFFSSPIRRMCGVYPAAVAAPSPVGLSYALSRGMCCGSSFVGSGRSTTILSIVAARSLPFQDVRPGDHHPQRSTVAIGHQALFGALFSSVGGILARLFPPKRALPSIASAGCHSHCTPPSSSHSATKTAQIRSKIPAAAQRRNESWTVLLGPTARAVGPTGSRLEPAKMIAFSIFRQLATFRPVGFFGQNSRGSARSAATTCRRLPRLYPAVCVEASGGPWLSLLSLCPEVVTACYKLLPAKGVPPVLG